MARFWERKGGDTRSAGVIDYKGRSPYMDDRRVKQAGRIVTNKTLFTFTPVLPTTDVTYWYLEGSLVWVIILLLLLILILLVS